MKQSENIDRQLKHFGWMLLVIDVLLGIWLASKGHSIYVNGVVFIGVLFFTLRRPQFFTLFYRAWMVLGSLLNFVSTRVVLFVLLYFIVTPMSLVMRAFGKIFLTLNHSEKINSYWLERDETKADIELTKKQY